MCAELRHSRVTATSTELRAVALLLLRGENMVGFSSPRALRIVTRRLARCVVASPAAVVACLFVVRPEALGSPATKLALMAIAGCLLMTIGELSNALTRWALPRLKARAAAAEARLRVEPVSPNTMLEVLTNATLTAAPQSTRF